MHKTRPPPLPDSCSLSRARGRRKSSIMSHASDTKTLLVPLPFSPSLSLFVSVWGGGVFLVRMHIYTIYRYLSHTMYYTLASPSYISWVHSSYAHKFLGSLPVTLSRTTLSSRSSSPSLSNSPSTWVTHTHAYLTRTR